MTVHLAFFGDYSLFDNLDEIDARGGSEFNSPAQMQPSQIGDEGFEPTQIDTDDIPDDMPL